MTEPHIEEDIEVYFTHGEPLFIHGIVLGRDTHEIITGTMLIQRHEQPGLDEIIRVTLAKANCWRVTRRVVEPEPKAPGE
jgi:hypothetical protein